MSSDAVAEQLQAHAAQCEHPWAACQLCQAYAELERRAADVDAVRLERDEARSRLAMFYSVLQRSVTPLISVARQLVAAEGIDVDGAIGEQPARVPDEVFDAIQDRADRATELRYVERQLTAATARLDRFRSLHARHAARAVMPLLAPEVRESAKAFAGLLAHAWHGDGWDGDPLDPLDEVPLYFFVPQNPQDLREVPDA